jgi:hypothetical protein
MGSFDNLADHGFEPETCPTSDPVSVPRIRGRYAAVTLRELTSGEWDTVFPAKARLYLYLSILSVRGTREVHMTNAAAQAIRISRALQRHHLRELEAAGVIAMRRNGHEAPWVRVVKLA